MDSPSNIRWQRVNTEPFEYAIQQGRFGDEFVKLLDGTCLRRIPVDVARPTCGMAIADDEAVMAVGRFVIEAMKCRKVLGFQGQHPLFVEYFDNKDICEVSNAAGDSLMVFDGLRSDDPPRSVTFRRVE